MNIQISKKPRKFQYFSFEIAENELFLISLFWLDFFTELKFGFEVS